MLLRSLSVDCKGDQQRHDFTPHSFGSNLTDMSRLTCRALTSSCITDIGPATKLRPLLNPTGPGTVRPCPNTWIAAVIGLDPETVAVAGLAQVVRNTIRAGVPPLGVFTVHHWVVHASWTKKADFTQKITCNNFA